MFSENSLLNLFDNVLDDPMFATMNVPDIMRTDIYELEGNLFIEVELPGYEKQDVRAELSKGELTITAAKPQRIEMELSKRNYLRRERHTGGCKRKYFIGEDVKQEDIQAAFKDGVLKVLIKRENRLQDNRKLIEIK